MRFTSYLRDGAPRLAFVDADVVRIGALRRIAALEDDAELAAALPALVECAGRIAHPAVRNRGTIGGNVAHADPASGVPPVLLAHDTEGFDVVCYSGTLREDAVTERFRAAATLWRPTLGMSDAALVAAEFSARTRR